MQQKIFLFFLTALTLFSFHCATTSDPKDEEPTEHLATLEPAVSLFHRFMRWEMFDEASQFVIPKQKMQFLSRYEREKDHIDITSISLIDVDPKDSRTAILISRVEWYEKPAQILRTARFKEVWTFDGQQWLLKSRDLATAEDDEQDEKEDLNSPSSTEPLSAEPFPAS